MYGFLLLLNTLHRRWRVELMRRLLLGYFIVVRLRSRMLKLILKVGGLMLEFDNLKRLVY
jgi:hypothetical protein